MTIHQASMFMAQRILSLLKKSYPQTYVPQSTIRADLNIKSQPSDDAYHRALQELQASGQVVRSANGYLKALI